MALSERERKIIDELERSLRADEQRRRSDSRTRRRLWFGCVLALLGVLVGLALALLAPLIGGGTGVGLAVAGAGWLFGCAVRLGWLWKGLRSPADDLSC